MKSLVSTFGILALSAVAFAASKSYDVKLAASAQFGGVQLKAGEYKVKVDGSTATFTPSGTNKGIAVPVKVEAGQLKYQYTAVETSGNGASTRIDAIQLGGTSTKIEFAGAATATNN
jgi:hypothetical protein